MLRQSVARALWVVEELSEPSAGPSRARSRTRLDGRLGPFIERRLPNDIGPVPAFEEERCLFYFLVSVAALEERGNLGGGGSKLSPTRRISDVSASHP